MQRLHPYLVPLPEGRSMRAKSILSVLALLIFSSVVRADGSNPYSNIFYGDGSNTRQVLDVFLPDADAPVPTIFMVHGGGYVFGDKLFIRPAVDFFVAQGYAVVTPNYRLAPSYPYPSPLNDIFCAYAWTLAHAEEYGFDLTRLAIMGESAGANAVAMLAAVDDPSIYLSDCAWQTPEGIKPAAAVLYYPPIDLSTCECRTTKQLAAVYLGFKRYDPEQEADIRAHSEQASPLPWLDGSEPPFLVFHGTGDTLIPTSESELFVEKVNESGGQARLVIIPDALHGFFARPAYAYTSESWQTATEFLRDLGISLGTTPS